MYYLLYKCICCQQLRHEWLNMIILQFTFGFDYLNLIIVVIKPRCSGLLFTNICIVPSITFLNRIVEIGIF